LKIKVDIEKRLEELEILLPREVNALNRQADHVKSLRQEDRDLKRLMRTYDGPADAPLVSNDQILAAVQACGGEGVLGHAVAIHLGVGPRNVARKLRKLVDDGHLTGDPETGYSLTAVTAVTAVTA
jgi:hypothetical protein